MRAKRKLKRKQRLWICVDPGIAGTGVAILSSPPLKLLHTEVIKSSPDDFWIDRCISIILKFREIVFAYTDPHYRHAKVYVETPNLWGKSGRSYAAAASGDLLRLSALVGMIALACHTQSVKFVEVGVAEWKGNLPKAVVKKRVMEAFCLKKIPNHAADAAGIGLWAAGRM